jgi:hypothetical protein
MMTTGRPPLTSQDRSRQQRLAWVNGPRWDWTRGRTARRWLVAAMALGLALDAACFLLGGPRTVLANAVKVLVGGDGTLASNQVVVALVQVGGSVLVTLSLLSFQLLMYLVIGPATRGVFWLWARDLDERQEARKRLVFRNCYTALALLAGPAAVVVAVIGARVVPGAGAGADEWLDAAVRLLLGIAYPVMSFALLLPAAVGAWIEPEVTADVA